jgi:hypothetical protein
MAKKGENKKTPSSSLEDIPFAEMMQMIMGQKGAGPLSPEAMSKVTESRGDYCGSSCAEMMREMILLDEYQVWLFAQVCARHRAQSPFERETLSARPSR